MYNFFTEGENRRDDCFLISGSDYNHIRNVLRMKAGDTFLVSCGGESHLCALERFEEDTVVARITQEGYQSTELGAEIYLFQGLPKADKMELIIQKAVDVLPDDTPEVLQRRIMEQCEWKIMPQAVSLFCQDKLQVEGRIVRILP